MVVEERVVVDVVEVVNEAVVVEELVVVDMVEVVEEVLDV